MRDNLVFKIVKDTITISKVKKDTELKNLNNTNVIDTKDLKFSTLYIEENFDLVSNFLQVVIIKKNITNIIINTNDIALLCLDLINTWDRITKITFKENDKINLNIVLKLMDNKFIKEIDCYEMYDYLIDRLDVSKNIKVTTRHKINFVSKFMNENFLVNYSDIYYKKSIIISKEFDLIELEDIKTFMQINTKLKYIKIFNFSNELITSILEEIKTYAKKNILIEIYEKDNDLNTIYNSINYLKKKYHKLFINNNIKIKVTYSMDYKKKNFLKEVNLKVLSTIILLIMAVAVLLLFIRYVHEFNDEAKIKKQVQEIQQIIEEFQVETDVDYNDPDITIVGSDGQDPDDAPAEPTTPSHLIPYYIDYEKVFEKLLGINNNTVGWLQVENTKINYPVVQSTDNKFYLSHDFYKNKNANGWVFLDYRVNPNELGHNTVIYGHNIRTGIVFGTIKYMLNPSWYTVPNNQIITFNTLNKNMKWQIFSIYKVEVTNDYLLTYFKDDNAFMDFVNLIKQRSIYDFGVELNPNSKILTLSTCSDSNSRNVIHAVLIEEPENAENIENAETIEE